MPAKWQCQFCLGMGSVGRHDGWHEGLIAVKVGIVGGCWMVVVEPLHTSNQPPNYQPSINTHAYLILTNPTLEPSQMKLNNL